MSKAKLKKYLQTLPQEQLVEIILDLYNARKEAKEYLEFFLEPDQEKALEKAKKDIFRNYFTPQQYPRAKVSFKTGKEIVDDFIHLDIEPRLVADLMLYHASISMSRIFARRLVSEATWNSTISLFRKAAEYIVTYKLRDEMERKIEKLVEYAKYAPEYLHIPERMNNELAELNFYES